MANKRDLPYFYQYETIDIVVKLKENGAEALQDYDEIVISIEQQPILVNVAKFDVMVEEGALVLHLSQEETGQFNKGTATLQVNIYKNRRRKATGYGYVEVRRNLYKTIMGEEGE